jgi:hypothetical protein
MKNTKHMWLMLACCLIPLASGSHLPFKIPVSTVLIIGMALFSPLSPILMMAFMKHDHGETQPTGPHIHNQIE